MSVQVVGNSAQPAVFSNITLTNPIGPGSGGTGVANPTAHAIPIAEGSSNYNFIGPLTNGQLLIGSTGLDPVAAAPTSSDGSITITTGAGTLGLTGTAASTSQKGSVSLATNAETIAGTDTTKAVTPDDLKVKLGTQTNHGVLVGAGTAAAVTALAVGATNSVLVGNTGADPSFSTSSTTYFSGVSFNSGTNVLSNYSEGSWTPTMTGGTTGGSTTYTTQLGRYTRVGRQVTAFFVVTWTAATGTGIATIGGLPFTILNVSNYTPLGIVITSSATFTASYTAPYISGTTNTTNAALGQLGSGQVIANLNIWNSGTVIGQLIYFV